MFERIVQTEPSGFSLPATIMSAGLTAPEDAEGDLDVTGNVGGEDEANRSDETKPEVLGDELL